MRYPQALHQTAAALINSVSRAFHNELRGFMLSESVSFAVPSNLPSADNVLLSWTWFKRIGNREMYQNCIAVDVAGSGTSSVSLSKMFEGNIGNGCTTKEGVDIDFANPSASLRDGCTPITPDQKVNIGPSGSSSGGGAAPAPAPSSSTDDKPTSTETPSSTATDASAPTETGEPETTAHLKTRVALMTARTMALRTTARVTAHPRPINPPPHPNPNHLLPPHPSHPERPLMVAALAATAQQALLSSLPRSICANGEYLNMGAVAPGTKCVDGKHVSISRREFEPSSSGRRSHIMRRLEWSY